MVVRKPDSPEVCLMHREQVCVPETRTSAGVQGTPALLTRTKGLNRGGSWRARTSSVPGRSRPLCPLELRTLECGAGAAPHPRETGRARTGTYPCHNRALCPAKLRPPRLPVKKSTPVVGFSVAPAGFEPATSSVSDWRLYHLGYAGMIPWLGRTRPEATTSRGLSGFQRPKGTRPHRLPNASLSVTQPVVYRNWTICKPFEDQICTKSWPLVDRSCRIRVLPGRR
jgi:hypothetical protein